MEIRRAMIPLDDGHRTPWLEHLAEQPQHQARVRQVLEYEANKHMIEAPRPKRKREQVGLLERHGRHASGRHATAGGISGARLTCGLSDVRSWLGPRMAVGHGAPATSTNRHHTLAKLHDSSIRQRTAASCAPSAPTQLPCP